MSQISTKIRNNTELFWSKVDKRTSNKCWPWLAGKQINGYGKLGIRLNGKTKMLLAHRVSWFLAYNKWPELHVLHKCDNTSCVNPSHLFEGTDKDNSDDKISKGRHEYGDRHHNSTLTTDKVREIKWLLTLKNKQRDIARMANVAPSVISNIKFGKLWKHVNTSVVLDIDGVICDFTSGLLAAAHRLGLSKEFPSSSEEVMHWDICDKFSVVFDEVKHDKNFWLGLKPLVKKLPFVPLAYLTARPIDSEITKKWLINNGFPDADVISVCKPEEKLQYLRELNPDVFVDDLYSTVIAANKAGINTVLMKQPYQRGHIEECKGLPTIERLEEICL